MHEMRFELFFNILVNINVVIAINHSKKKTKFKKCELLRRTILNVRQNLKKQPYYFFQVLFNKKLVV